MQHDATVALSPTSAASDLCAHKAVFNQQPVVSVRFCKKQMTELVREFFVVSIIYAQQTIFYNKGFEWILA